ncbi:MAG: DUF1592 domain-containing protein [Acidobacteriia bacterium]|nr:DUF1592 domain-containing protein [Terriglobia bacterium]
MAGSRFRIALLALGAAAAVAPLRSSDQALVKQYCTACHNDDAQTAGVSLQGLDPARPDLDPALWERVLRKVGSGEMPPSGLPAPEQSQRSEFVARLEQALDAAARANPDPGRPPAHRLNRAEYSNAVRDLLHLDLDLTTMLPGDDSGYGFDNIADVLTLSPALLDRYMFAARHVSRLAVGSAVSKPQKDIFVRDRETGFRYAGHAPASRLDLPIGSSRGTALKYYFPLAGEYVISAALDQGDSRTSYEHYQTRLTVQAGMRTLTLAFLGESSRAERTAPSGSSEPARPHPPFDIRLDGGRLELLQLPDAKQPFKLRWISVEGPFDPQGPGDTASRRKIFTCRPESAEQARPCAEKIVSNLARQAYRRPVHDQDLAALMAMYELGESEGGFESGIERTVRALLVSPSFLFRLEPGPEDTEPGKPFRISDAALASRLSFFLWSSLPDEELLAAAEQGRLRDERELERQVRRMLADRRANALVENFAGQWLELRKVARIKPDEILFPEFDSELRFAMRRETELFFADILKRNRSSLELLDADYTFLNERLAAHYGLAGVRGQQFRRVSLTDARRGGLLGQASVLAVTSYPNRTSVVIRGKWILENLFGMPPPPPPPDIPELEEAAPEGEHLTLRELMTLHSQSPTCASCHVRMDPIGFALENFDAIGRWRDKDGDVPIDASGELPGGIQFSGPEELKQTFTTVLKDAFARTVVEKLLTYALGRGLEYYDRPVVRAIAREGEVSSYRFADLIVAVTKSMPFQMRRGAE